jgi:hypothetical protein
VEKILKREIGAIQRYETRPEVHVSNPSGETCIYLRKYRGGLGEDEALTKSGKCGTLYGEICTPARHGVILSPHLTLKSGHLLLKRRVFHGKGEEYFPLLWPL